MNIFIKVSIVLLAMVGAAGADGFDPNVPTNSGEWIISMVDHVGTSSTFTPSGAYCIEVAAQGRSASNTLGNCDVASTAGSEKYVLRLPYPVTVTALSWVPNDDWALNDSCKFQVVRGEDYTDWAGGVLNIPPTDGTISSITAGTVVSVSMSEQFAAGEGIGVMIGVGDNLFTGGTVASCTAAPVGGYPDATLTIHYVRGSLPANPG
jgi:hypothetical protein